MLDAAKMSEQGSVELRDYFAPVPGLTLSTIGFTGVEAADEGIAQGVRYAIALLPGFCVLISI